MPTNHTPRPKSASRMLSMWFAWFIGLVMALAAPAHAAVTSGIIGFGTGAAPGAFLDVASDYNGLRFTGQWSYFAAVDLQAGTPGIITSGDAITSTTLDGNAIIKAANGTDRFSLAQVRIHAYGSMTQFTLTGYRGGSPVSGAIVTVTKTSPMTQQFVPIDLSALADVDEVRVSNNATVGEGGNFAFDDLAVDPFPPAAPTATALSPTSGLAAGGYPVTITGANFTNVIGSSIVTAVSFGGTPATSFTVNSATQITATAPAGSGTVNVTVTTAGGTSVTATANQFTYLPAPTVTSVSPNFGPQAGGTSVTITGTDLSGATAVLFGGTTATSYVVNSATQITATSPAGTGPVDVRVTTAGGTSAISGADQFSYLATPTITSISPTAGPQAGGTAVTITGTNFIGTTGVNFGASAATGFTVNSATSITATAPPGTGTVDIRVSNSVGTSPAVAADQFTYVAAPSVTSISPTAGPTGGGTTVIITGTGFAAAPGTGAVRFGATTATYTINSNTQITATAPAGSAGTVDVTVTTVGGTSATSAADQFTYVPAPTVTSISPTSGPTSGGTTVTITGTNFSGATAVTFGGTAASGFTVNSNTQITATAPAQAAGTIDVRVTTGGGTSATSAADQFTYVSAPTVTSVSPTAGPTAGGTSVVITGTNLSGATAVTFGATAATGFTVNGATQITATAPAGTGTVDVRITTVGGTSATSAADQFTYVPAPTVTSVSPASGSSIGGTTVTLTGTNFTGATAVTFGGTAATGFTVNSATQITATAPAGSAGTVDVRVTTTGGTSATGAAGQFTYVAITVTPATLAGTPKVGVSFNETLTASGGATPYTFAMASGSTLPTGLSLSPAGVISGTPTAAGAFSFTVQATDNSSISGQRTYSGSVTAATVVLTPAASTLPAARLNTAYAGQTFTASGGTAPYTYASSGTLPTGMTFNASTGVLSGTPTAAGSFTFTITATDSSTGTGAPFTSGSTSYTLVVNSTNADLSALALSSGTLAPGFGAGTLAYTATVPNSSSTVTVTATAADAGATILVNGAAASTPVALNVGSNTVSIEVTAQDGTTKKTYVVTVTREARQSASGSGVDLGIANSSPTCTLTAANFTSPSAVAGSLGPLPAAFAYPQAAVDFTAKQCAPSSTLTVTLTFTSPVPANAQLMKYDATATPKWQPFTPTISGNQVSYTIVDGGLRDDDKTVNGEFVDPVILAVPAPPSAQSIPTLDRWGLLLLSLMAGAAGFMGMARRQRTGR